MSVKPSQFNSFFDSLFPGTFLAYNSFSGALLTLSTKEKDEAFELLTALEEQPEADLLGSEIGQRLRRSGFIIPDALDERAEVKRKYFERGATTKGMSLTIAPTVSCNFACSYCFQEHPKRTMSREEIEAIVARVDQGLEPGTSLGIVWFGGEPLMALPVVRELAERLAAICKSRGAALSQSMVSNGYLMDEEVVDFLAAQPGFRYVQVTVDGPPRLHDARRYSASGQPTFARILDNVERASKKIRVTLRCNIDRTNVEGLEDFVEELVARGLQSRVSVYLGHVQPYTDVCAGTESAALSKAEFAAADAQLRLLLFQRGFLYPASRPTPNRGALCVADHPNGAVFAPDGLEFKCWNEVAMAPEHASARYAGEAESPKRRLPLLTGKDAAPDSTGESMARNMEGWTGYNPFSHEPCGTCHVMPLCRGGCPWESRKRDVTETGHCTPYRWNLGDMLRIHHVSEIVRIALSKPTPSPDVPCQ